MHNHLSWEKFSLDFSGFVPKTESGFAQAFVLNFGFRFLQ